MKIFALILIICGLGLAPVSASHRIMDILNHAEDLSQEEQHLLLPLFDELQTQYDYVLRETEMSVPVHDDDLINAVNLELEELLRSTLVLTTPIDYDTTLPSLQELMGDPSIEGMTQEQLNEFHDMQSILQDVLDEAQTNINEIVERARLTEATLIKINKPKIVEYIYKALSMVFQVAARASRAAYCTYSHTPQLNSSLQHVNGGVDCYKYTSALVLRVQTEAVESVRTIRKNVYDLAGIYIKTAEKNSLVGKIVYLLLNVNKISTNIRETYAVVMHGLELVQNELPDAAAKSVDCGKNFASAVPEVVETVSSLTTCILYVDDTTNDYDFMKPEEERENY